MDFPKNNSLSGWKSHKGFCSAQMTWRGWGFLKTAAAREILKAAWEKAGFFWHEKFREKHFSAEGAKEYGYSPRAGEQGRPYKKFFASYAGRKQKKMGHSRPLVWSGDSANSARLVNLDPNSKGVTIRINAPKFNFHKAGSPINMWDEMTRVSDREIVAITEVLEKEIMAAIDRDVAENGSLTEAR